VATRCAVDIGGTFTDFVHLDEGSADVGLSKSSTTPSRFEQGVMNAIGRVDLAGAEFLAHARRHARRRARGLRDRGTARTGASAPRV